MTQALILKRASASRSSGQWRDDDYDVLEGGVVVGRIFCLDAVGPQGRPWMWASGHESARHSATSRRGRRRWLPSPRAGAETASWPWKSVAQVQQAPAPVVDTTPASPRTP